MNVKISNLTPTNSILSTALVTVVDVSDKSMALSGTNKKMTLTQFANSSATSLSDESINGSKIARGTLTADRFAPGVIPTVTNTPGGQLVDTAKIDTALADLNTRLAELKGKITPGTQLFADEIGANTITTFNLYSDKVTANTILVGELSAKVGEIGTLYANLLETVNLKAGTAAVGNLYATTANVVSIVADYVKTDKLVTELATINTAIIKKATIDDLIAERGRITDLESTVASIDELVAKKATILSLNAANADITKLRTDYGTINTLVAQKATIDNLETTNANIDYLDARIAKIDEAVIGKATIGNLNSTNAEVERLDAKYVKVSGDLTAINAEVKNIKADYITTDDLTAATARIGKLESNSISTGNFEAYAAAITRLDTEVAKIGTLDTNYITVSDILTATNINVGTIQGEIATFDTIYAKNLFVENYIVENNLFVTNTYTKVIANEAAIGRLTVDFADINTLVAQKATITNLDAANAEINKLKTDYLNVSNTLTATNIVVGSLKSDYVTTAKLETEQGRINTLNTNYTTVSGQLTAARADIDTLEGQTATFNTLYVAKADIDDLIAGNADVKNKLTANEVAAQIISAKTATFDTLYAKLSVVDELVINKTTVNELIATKVTADQVDAQIVNAKVVTTDTLIAKVIESNIINAKYASIDSIQTGGITAGKIAAGSVGIDQLNNTIGSIDTLSSKFIMATNIASSNFNGQVVTDSLGNVTSINVGDKGYYMDAASGTMIVNKLVAREGVISGKYIQFNKEGAFTVDSAGNLDVQVDASTIGVTGGKISILKVPSTSIVTVTQDINYIGGSNNTVFTPIQATNGSFHYSPADIPGLAGTPSPGPTKSDIIMRWDILANPGGINGPTYFTGGKLHNFSMILNYANIKNATNATSLEIALYAYWSDEPTTLTNSPAPTKTSLGVVTGPILKLGDNTYTFPPIQLPMPNATNRYLLFVPSVVIKANSNTQGSYTTAEPGVTATATVAGTASNWTITKALSGSGYSNPPIVTITGGTRTVVGTAIAKLGLTNKSFTVTSGNKVYSVAPTVIITGGSPSVAATATAILTAGVVTGINITNMGDGYFGSPTATFTGGTVVSGGAVSPSASFINDEFTVSSITKDINGTYSVKPTGATLSAPPPRTSYLSRGFESVENGVLKTSTIDIRIPANTTMALTVSAAGTITSFSNPFSNLIIASGTKLSIP